MYMGVRRPFPTTEAFGYALSMRRKLIQLMTSLAVACMGGVVEEAGAWESPTVVRARIDDSSRDMEAFIRLYSADRTSVQRFHGLPWCEERLDRLTSLSSVWRASLGQLDFAALDQHGKVDYVLLET